MNPQSAISTSGPGTVTEMPVAPEEAAAAARIGAEVLKICPHSNDLARKAYEWLHEQPGNLPALFEPRHYLTPAGYEPAIARPAFSFLYMTESVYKVRERGGFRDKHDPTVDLLLVNYAGMRDAYPTYFVSEMFARAVAATTLPRDVHLAELCWPRSSLFLSYPLGFLSEYLGCPVENGHVAVALVPGGDVDPPKGYGFPSFKLEAPTVVFSWCVINKGIPESYGSHAPLEKTLDSFTNAPFSRWAAAGPDDIPITDDQQRLHRMISLTYRTLLILGTRPGLITEATCCRPQKAKAGRVIKRELWSPAFIGQAYRPMTQDTKIARAAGGHASPRLHWRRGHLAHTRIGPKDNPDFLAVNSIPRDSMGDFDWANCLPEYRERFWRCHKRVWIDPVLVNADPDPTRWGSAERANE